MGQIDGRVKMLLEDTLWKVHTVFAAGHMLCLRLGWRLATAYKRVVALRLLVPTARISREHFFAHWNIFWLRRETNISTSHAIDRKRRIGYIADSFGRKSSAYLISDQTE